MEQIPEWNSTVQCHIPCRMTYDRSILDTADAVWFHMWDLYYDKQKLPPNPRGIPFIAHSLESPRLVPILADSQFMSQFSFENIYTLHSAIPRYYPNILWEMFQPPLPIEQKTNEGQALAVIFASNCDLVYNYRTEYVKELMKYISVDSYGKCLNNKKTDLPKTEVIRKYKFTLAFENSNCEDYVTEKIYQPLVAGSVPVYMGAANIAAFAPFDHSYIDVNDFLSVKDLADYLIKLDKNDTLYNSYLWFKEVKDHETFMTPEAKQTRKYPLSLCDLCVRVAQETERRERKEVHKIYVRSDETCENFPVPATLVNATIQHDIGFETADSTWISYSNEVGGKINSLSAHSGSHSLSLSGSPLVASYAHFPIKEKNEQVSAVMISVWGKTTSPEFSSLRFTLLFSDSSTLPLQTLPIRSATWEYVCAVVPTYKPIASVFVMPTLITDNNVSMSGAYAEFDDLRITTFTELFTPRRYFNSFPPECQVVQDSPIFSPRIHLNFLKSHCELSDTSITLCTHVHFAKFDTLPLLATKWKGPMSIVVLVSSEREVEAVGRKWRAHPILTFFASIHLIYASERYGYSTKYFREIAISEAPTPNIFYIPSNYIIPSNMHNSLNFAAKHLNNAKSPSVFIVPVFSSLSPQILSLNAFGTYIPDSKDDLLSKLARKEHFDVVYETENKIVNFQRWTESSEQFYYKDIISSSSMSLESEAFYIARKGALLLFPSNLPDFDTYTVSQLFAIQLEPPPLSRLEDFLLWETFFRENRISEKNQLANGNQLSQYYDFSFKSHELSIFISAIAPVIALSYLFIRAKRRRKV